jgi:hypothetical protein
MVVAMEAWPARALSYARSDPANLLAESRATTAEF